MFRQSSLPLMSDDDATDPFVDSDVERAGGKRDADVAAEEKGRENEGGREKGVTVVMHEGGGAGGGGGKGGKRYLFFPNQRKSKEFLWS